MVLLSNTAFVRLNGQNMKYYENIGYFIPRRKNPSNGRMSVPMGTVIEVSVEHLPKKSHSDVEYKCDYCQEISHKSYSKYNTQLEASIVKKDCCGSFECQKDKREEGMIEKYGVHSPILLKEFKDEIEKTNIKRYGVKNPMQNKNIRQKAEKTNLEKYGSTNVMHNQDIKNKVTQTNLKRYGFEVSTKNPDVQKKAQLTNLERYGVRHALQNVDIKKKKEETNILRYGFKNAIQNKEVKTNWTNAILHKYGVEHPMQNPSISSKNIQTPKEFSDKFSNTYGSDYHLLDDYKVWDSILKVRHLNCGEVFNVKATRLQQITWRCPTCYTKGMSNGSISVKNSLISHNIPYDTEQTFSGCVNERVLRFDYSINKDFVLIEYDGQQHFFPVDFAKGSNSTETSRNYDKIVIRDKIKNQYCIDNNIPLLRIPYWESDNIEAILESVLMHYKIIERSDAYDVSKFKQYLVDGNWNHNEYLAKRPKNKKELKTISIN